MKSNNVLNISSNVFKMLFIVIICFFISLGIGRYDIGFSNIDLILSIRFPRVLLALSTGGILALCGLLFQMIFKNPIASPDILGVSSGACFGSALAIILPFSFFGKVQILSFVFAMIAVILTYSLNKFSKDKSLLYLILSGIIVSAFFSASYNFLKYIADPYEELPSIVFWAMGGLYRSTYTNSIISFILLISSTFLIHKLYFKISILTIDDELAISMGLDVQLFRWILLCWVSFLVAYVISLIGIIGWISLVIPHISLFLFPNSRYRILLTALSGMLCLIILDTLARSLFSFEIPIGILSSIFSTPILAYLIFSKKFIRKDT
jgi:iron complex transport system permease protein